MIATNPREGRGMTEEKVCVGWVKIEEFVLAGSKLEVEVGEDWYEFLTDAFRSDP